MSSATAKKISRPGRKPLTTEPKNKRTAQNRAAQRAFRERKERKMHELEDKVKLLEDEKTQIANETKLLRTQVETLVQELAKYRQGGGSPTVGPSFGATTANTSARYEAVESSPASFESSNGSTPVLASSWQTPASSDSSHTNSKPSFQFPGEWGAEDAKRSLNQSSLKEGTFDEPVNEFCAELGQVCGTRDCPIPKSSTNSVSSSHHGSRLSKSNQLSPAVHSLESPSTQTGAPFANTAKDISPFYNLIQNKAPQQPLSQQDDLSSIFDHMSKTDLANPNPDFDPNDFLLGDIDEYDQDEDLLKGLVTETSKYDALDAMNTNLLTNSQVVAPKVKKEEVIPDDEDESVPNTNDNLIQCSQIWERITSHPRFSELDIDGLCSELKQKAKCSEHGVVVDGGDVGRLIAKSLDDKDDKNQFLKGVAF